jgi:hypothetical protein
MKSVNTPESLRLKLFKLSRALEYPTLEFQPGCTILEGQVNWALFIARNTIDDLEAALAALETLEDFAGENDITCSICGGEISLTEYHVYGVCEACHINPN